MRRFGRCWRLALVAAWIAASCNRSTGGEITEFEAFAAGPEGLEPGQPYVFENDRGFTVTLTRAIVRVGAVYMNESVPTSVSSDTSCYLAGLYVAEVPGGFDIDALDPGLQPFPVPGFATTDRARTGELWLSGGDLEADNDTTVILDIEGEAERVGEVFPFEAQLTIGDNRREPADDPAQPGSRPICKQRVVTPLELDITPTVGGRLVLRIDPARWFSNVAFDRLEQVGSSPPRYRFRDDSEDQPSRNLFHGLRANAGVYQLTWEE